MAVRTVIVVGVVLVGATMAWACPNCAEALPGSRGAGADAASPAGVADGFYWSILFMLAVPYTLAGVGAWWLWRTTKRSASGRAGLGGDGSGTHGVEVDAGRLGKPQTAGG